MKRVLLVVLAIVAIAGVAWVLTGGFGRSVEARIESQLVAKGLPRPMAQCMAGRMADRLSVSQLRKLEQLAPREDEADVPLTVAALLERVRRVDDPEVLEVTAGSAAVCAFSTI